ncbi:hypothetical protein BGZ51_000336, partial [Haplosporangium sp. Z 767]
MSCPAKYNFELQLFERIDQAEDQLQQQLGPLPLRALTIKNRFLPKSSLDYLLSLTPLLQRLGLTK